MGGGSVGTDEEEEVWEVLRRDAEVADGKVAKLVVDLCVVAAVDFEVRCEGGVEAGGADDDVDFVFIAVFVDDAGLSEFCDGFGDDGHVFGEEGLQIAAAGGHSAAAEGEGWDHVFCERFVMAELGGHYVGDEVAGDFLVFGFEVHLMRVVSGLETKSERGFGPG